jgi:hypothetical protein
MKKIFSGKRIKKRIKLGNAFENVKRRVKRNALKRRLRKTLSMINGSVLLLRGASESEIIKLFEDLRLRINEASRLLSNSGFAEDIELREILSKAKINFSILFNLRFNETEKALEGKLKPSVRGIVKLPPKKKK